MNHMEIARRLRPVIEQAVQSLDDTTALAAVTLYPEWAENTAYTQGHKVRWNGRLWRCMQGHGSLTGWEPENAPSLWERIDETHPGTLTDPIPYDGSMALTAGVYYVQYGVVYLCIRDTGNPVYSELKDLVGIYTEMV